ncbi:MAG TPA: acyl-CoA dehydrogenase family protein [Solirubrobacterales bacterium]|nr:acyl-CoA dehydrogenase family protein [Solirubrobacterales bacterium]
MTGVDVPTADGEGQGAEDGAMTARLDRALAQIAAAAAELDRAPRFPREAFLRLADAGALAATIGAVGEGRSVRPEWDLLRRVAATDASVARVLDGHLNAVERLEVAADPDLRGRELAAVAAGERLLGVWGADPGPGEGDPARLAEAGAGRVLRGVKTFCSGAGGVDAALVMVGNDAGEPPALVLLDCGAEVEVDRSWYRAAGLRASESHRVVFRDAPVTAVLGAPGELARDPWFSRDAMRTAATWAGMVDAAASAALDELAEHRADEPLAQLAAGRIEAAVGTVDAWLERAAAVADAALAPADPARPVADRLHLPPPGGGKCRRLPRATGIAMRAEIDRAAKAILAEAAAACGSHPFVTGGRLDRARRDLETFLLQHRLDPLLARLGAEGLARR